MIIDQLENQSDFTNTEKQIADYILGHSAEITDLSARMLSEKAYASKASIIRFCQKLNFSGYEEFKTKLTLENEERARIALLLEKEPVNKETSLKEITSIVPNIYTNAINTMNLGLDETVLRRIISHIRKATTVDIYGVGITYTCATTAKFKFRSIGINCNTYSGINEHYITSTRKENNRVAIILTFTGANSSMIKIAEYLKANGTYVIGIGGNDSNDLKDICDDYIEIAFKELVLSMEVVSPFIAFTYVFDVLFLALLVADFDKNVEAAIEVINYRGDHLW